MIVGMTAGAVIGLGATICLRPGVVGEIHRTLGDASRRLLALLRRSTGRRFAADLDITGRSDADLVVSQLGLGLVGSASGSALALFVAPSVPAVGAAMVIGAFIGHSTAVSRVRREARERRRRFRHAFSAYLDLVNVLLAGGAGMETALTVAADAGDGWSFDMIRSCLVRARVARRSPWDELSALGRRLDVPDLVEVAGTISLSGEHGARVRGSLSARAEALRHRQLAEIEARAQAATERMGVPLVLLFVSFIGLLGYPALQMVVMAM